MTLSVVMVTDNSKDVIEGALESIKGLWEELLVGDGGSTDGTIETVKRYGGTVVLQKAQTPLGVRKQELVEQAKGDWILVLDPDERVGEKLRKEIQRICEIASSKTPRNDNVRAYRIPYQNYVFGSPVQYGGETYSKVRLFRRGYGSISPEPLHEEVIIHQKTHKATPLFIGQMSGVIHHHSYRGPWQLFTKFTRYAWIAAGMVAEKEDGFRVKPGMTVKRLFLYGPHMFWARFVKEKGYKDGWRGWVLAAAFGYMEGLTQWFMLIRKP